MKIIDIMLVEDDEVFVMQVTRILAKLDLPHQLIVRNNGEDALEYLQNTDSLPAFVLLDINMPRMSGLELLEIIREDERLNSMLIYILTTSMESSDLLKAREGRVAGYIEKKLKMADVADDFEVLSKMWKKMFF